MKSCPTCNRTYPDDTLAFCLDDGSVLSAAYDPANTRRDPERSRESTRTQVLNPTVPSEPATPMQPTMVAPTPQVPPLQSGSPPWQPGSSQSFQSEGGKSKAPWIIAAVAVLLAIVSGVVLLATQWSGKSDTAIKQANPTPSPEVEKKEKLACNLHLSAVTYNKWILLGGEKGRLGCPVEGESDAPTSPQGTTGRWLRFTAGDGGYLVLHQTGPNAGKAFEVTGCMFKVYSSMGGTKSWLGFPVSDGREIATGARQDFEAGYVLWDSKTYTCEAHRTLAE